MDPDSHGEMYRLPFREPPFSEEMADRLLSGQVPVSDAPPALRGLAALMETAASGPVAEETAHKATVVAFAAAAVEAAGTVHSHSQASQAAPTSGRRSMLSKLLTAKAAVGATALALGLGTAAAAATGALPTQHANSHADAGLAIAASSQSGTNGNSNGHGKNSNAANSTGAANNPHAQFGLCTAFMQHHPTSSSPSVPSDSSKTFKALIANPAHSGLASTWTYCQGVIAQHSATTDTGDTADTPDQNGTDQPGGTGNKPSNAGPPSSTPPVSTPNSGGTGTAGTASDGASSGGTTTAGGASGGASTSGSGNARGN